jgi:hypothetical protein
LSNSVTDSKISSIAPVERSFYSPIREYLNDLGFAGVTELKGGKDYVDIFFQYEDERYIVEIKIATGSNLPQGLIEGVVQAYRYTKNKAYSTKNIIVICYPEDVRREIKHPKEVEERALERNTQALILTKQWHKYCRNITVEDLFSSLKHKIESRLEVARNIKTAAHVIQNAIKHLSKLVRKSYGGDSSQINEIAKYLGDEELITENECDKAEKFTETEVIDIISLILVNQILFYFLYSKRKNDKNDKL